MGHAKLNRHLGRLFASGMPQFGSVEEKKSAICHILPIFNPVNLNFELFCC